MIKEMIKWLNEYCSENSVFYADDIGGELRDKLEEYNFKFVDTVERDEHRWYILAMNVYRLDINELAYFIGCWELETVMSEDMNVNDVGCIVKFFEMEPYTTISYRVKKGD